MNQANNVIGNNIGRLRKQRSMTQEQLANGLGVSYQAVSKWENGQTCPDINHIPLLADIFGITIDEIFGRSVQSIDLRRGLVLEYLFDGDVRDTSGEESHGRLEGGDYGTDRFGWKGGALMLDGRSHYVRIDKPPTLSGEAFSISVWCYYDAHKMLRGWHSAIVSQDGHHQNRALQLSTKDEYITFHGFLREPDLMMNARIVKEHWYHVALTYEKSRYRMYVNGQFVSERSGSFTPCENEPMYVGRKSTEEPYFFFHGAVDDLRIYNRAVGEREIEALYLENGYKPVPVYDNESSMDPIPVLDRLDDIRMIFTKDTIELAADWYTRYLGFKILMQEEGFYMLTLYNSPNLLLEIMDEISESGATTAASFIFTTNRDIEQLRSYLSTAGARVEQVRDEGFAWFLDITDPFGRGWMIMREKSSSSTPL